MEASLYIGSATIVAGFFVAWKALSSDERRGASPTLSAAHPQAIDLRAAVLERGIGDRTFQPLLDRFATAARRMTPGGWLRSLERRILTAGTPKGWTLERVMAAKGVFGLTTMVVGVLRLVVAPSGGAFFMTLLMSAFLFFLPDLLLKNMGDKREVEIRRSLSETIDQLAISVQAGLGLDSAIARVSKSIDGPLGAELARVVQDTQAGVPRIDAMIGLSERIRLPELRQFVAALAQAEKLGVPVAQTLKVQAAEMRLKRRQSAEEMAMKIPVKILFPTVVCILPTLFIVLLGPAAINIFRSL